MLTFLVDLPAVVRVGVMFVGILALNRAGIALGFSVMACAFGLVAWSGAGLEGFAWQLQRFLTAGNLLLLLVILLLLFFTEVLSVSGRIPRTVESLRVWLNRPRLLLAGLPALIGLLPMPGGALVSAPMVASADPESQVELPRKVAVNYWFRHIWEYWWPLYPGVVVAMRYCRLPVGWFYLLMAPFTFVAVAGGTLFILRHIEARPQAQGAGRLDWPGVRAALWPIALLVVVSIAGSAVIGKLAPGDNANLYAMLLAQIVALAAVFSRTPGAARKASGMFRRWKMWSLVLVVAGVQLFSAALAVPLSDTGETLVGQMAGEFASFGVPALVVIALVPFVAGVVTGIAVGFVGVSFPLVFGLVAPDAGLGELAATTALAYGFGYAGMMLSPIHICFVVTSGYFKTPIARAYPYLIGPLALMATASILLWSVYRLF